MNELLNVNFDTQTVSARELHEQLEISKRFSAWFETNSQGFVEGEDFTSVLKGTEVQNNGGIQVRELQDYNLTVDMAKHLCLMSRTEKGKQCRQYLLDLEKAWNTPEQVMARALKIANRTIDSLKEHNTKLIEDCERMKPKEIFADAVSASKTSILIGDLAKLICQNGCQIGQKRLFEWMRANGYLILRKGSDYNMPTQRSMEMGLFEIKESTHLNGDGLNVISKTPKVTGKGQQYFINKFMKQAEAV
nr:MAG TPA: KilAC domain protein [Bacteriophage sp.]